MCSLCFYPTSAFYNLIVVKQHMHNYIMKALIQVKTVRQPISGNVLGFRIQAAVPNEAGRVMRANFNGEGQAESFYATKETAPSFRRPYFISETSDYTTLGIREVDRFLKDLQWQGYRKYEFVGKMWERLALTELLPSE